MSVIHVSPECALLGLRAGAIVFRDVQISDATSKLRRQIDAAAEKVQADSPSHAAIRRLPEIARHHAILRAVGVKPRNHPPSTQKLLEYAWKNSTLPPVNNLVDAYNLVSIETRCSLGAHDTDWIALPVELRTFAADESFVPLGQNGEQSVPAGEFGYVDARGRVLCRLDSLQADFSKVTAETKRVMLIVEGTDALTDVELRNAVDFARKTVQNHCGGIVETVTYPDRLSVPSAIRSGPMRHGF